MDLSDAHGLCDKSHSDSRDVSLLVLPANWSLHHDLDDKHTAYWLNNFEFLVQVAGSKCHKRSGVAEENYITVFLERT